MVGGCGRDEGPPAAIMTQFEQLSSHHLSLMQAPSSRHMPFPRAPWERAQGDRWRQLEALDALFINGRPATYCAIPAGADQWQSRLMPLLSPAGKGASVGADEEGGGCSDIGNTACGEADPARPSPIPGKYILHKQLLNQYHSKSKSFLSNSSAWPQFLP